MSSNRRGPYTINVCTRCRSKKLKCDGAEPTCGPCQRRGNKCEWGQSAKQPTAKSVVDSLRTRIQALEKENCRLHDALLQYNDPTALRLSISDVETECGGYTSVFPSSKPEASDIDALLTATKRLVIESDELRLYGPTSAFSLDPDENGQVIVPSRSRQLGNQGIYVLYSDDNIHWNRHLPPTILTRREHDHLLDILFKFIIPFTLRVVPQLFLRDMQSSLSSPHYIVTEYYSPMLHNALIAFGCSFSDDPILHDIQSREVFLQKAGTFLDSECKKPNISAVQALNIISTCRLNQTQQTLGYMYFGMAGRLCQALGLGLYPKDLVHSGKISEEYLASRNWTYWSLFYSDIGWSLYLGRDFCLPDPEDDIEKGRMMLPVASADMDEEHWNWTHLNIKALCQPCHMTSTFVANSELTRIGRKISHVVNAGVLHKKNYKEILEIDSQLNGWKVSLSPALDVIWASRRNALPHRLVMHLVYWWLFTILHRPFYNIRKSSSGGEIDHVKICDRAVYNIMVLLAIYDDLYSVRYITTVLIQVMFSAGIVSVLSAIRALSNNRVSDTLLHDSLSRADGCLKYLTKASKGIESAIDMKRILENVIRAWVVPRLTPGIREVGILPIASTFGGDLSWEHELETSSEPQQLSMFHEPSNYTYPYIGGSETSIMSNLTQLDSSLIPHNIENSLPWNFPTLNDRDFDVGSRPLYSSTTSLGMALLQELEDDLARFLS